jgi:hypothetical protein
LRSAAHGLPVLRAQPLTVVREELAGRRRRADPRVEPLRAAGHVAQQELRDHRSVQHAGRPDGAALRVGFVHIERGAAQQRAGRDAPFHFATVARQAIELSRCGA